MVFVMIILHWVDFGFLAINIQLVFNNTSLELYWVALNPGHMVQIRWHRQLLHNIFKGLLIVTYVIYKFFGKLLFKKFGSFAALGITHVFELERSFLNIFDTWNLGFPTFVLSHQLCNNDINKSCVNWHSAKKNR